MKNSDGQRAKWEKRWRKWNDAELTHEIPTRIEFNSGIELKSAL
jgi:hypothetical protein